jgi:hypothetical protein
MIEHIFMLLGFSPDDELVEEREIRVTVESLRAAMRLAPDEPFPTPDCYTLDSEAAAALGAELTPGLKYEIEMVSPPTAEELRHEAEALAANSRFLESLEQMRRGERGKWPGATDRDDR